MAVSNYWIIKNKNFEFIPKTKEGKAPENVIRLIKPFYLSNGVSIIFSEVYKRKKKVNCSRLNFVYQGYIIYKREVEHKAYYMDQFGIFVDDLNKFNQYSSQELALFLEQAQEKAWKKIKKEKAQIDKLIIKLAKKSRKKEKELRDLGEVLRLTRRQL